MESKEAFIYTASAVAFAVIDNLKEGDENFDYYLGLALDGIREMNFDYSPMGLKTQEIQMSVSKQIRFPRGFVDYVKIGIRCGETIKIFTRDPNLSKKYDKDSDCENKAPINCPHVTELEIGSEPIDFYSSENLNGVKYYGYPTKGSNGLGYFDIDYENKTINISHHVDYKQVIYLEYITDGINYDGDTLVNPYCFEALKTFVKWQRVENNDEAPLSLKARWEANFKKEMHRVEERLTPLSIEDIIESLWAGKSLAV